MSLFARKGKEGPTPFFIRGCQKSGIYAAAVKWAPYIFPSSSQEAPFLACESVFAYLPPDDDGSLACYAGTKLVGLLCS